MPIKSPTTMWGVKRGKKSKSIYKTSQKIRIINVSLESLLSECFPSLRVSPLHFPRMPPNTVLISKPAVGAAQTLIWFYSCVFLPPMSTAVRASAFSFVAALNDFYIFHRLRICLVDLVYLTGCLYSWWEGFGSSSLATLILGFIVVLFPHLLVGSPLGFAPEAALEALGLPH